MLTHSVFCPYIPSVFYKSLSGFTSEMVSFQRWIELFHIMYLGKALLQPLGRKSLSILKEDFAVVCILSAPLTSVGFTGEAEVYQKPLCNLQLLERWGFRFFMSISLPCIHEFWLLMQFVSKALLNWQAVLMGVHAQMVWLWIKNKSFVCIQGNWTQYLITRHYCTFIWMPYRFKTRCTTSGNQLFCRLNLISAAL